MVMNRRNFLKAAAGGTLAATCAAPVAAREQKPMPESAVGLLFDGTLCIGCRACMSACKEENGLPPELNEIEGSQATGMLRSTFPAARSTSSRRTSAVTAT